MSSLSVADRRTLEKYLGMSNGLVLDFGDRTFGEVVTESTGLDIHNEKYTKFGTSKAKKLREFWKLESNSTVGTLLVALIDHGDLLEVGQQPSSKALSESCRQIAARLLAGGASLEPLRGHARDRGAGYLSDQIRRMERAVESDPGLAIGTAKELIETCCKTILEERGKPVLGTPDVSTLTKATLKELRLVPEGVPDAARGADAIRRLLSNLGAIGNGMAELRGLYGTGHGKHALSKGLTERHAKLAVGVAAALVVFLFETHKEQQP